MKYHTEWNLGLLYKSDKDPQIEKDVSAHEKACAEFEKKYKKADFLKTPQTLANALKNYVALIEENGSIKPWWYFMLRSHLNANDKIAAAQSTKLEERFTVAGNKIAFFMLAVSALSKERQKLFLNDPALSQYRYMLEQAFELAQYNLSEKEEQLLGLLSSTSYTAWIQGQERTLSQHKVAFKGKEYSQGEAISMFSHLNTRDRAQISKAVNNVFKANSDFAEKELNAICNYQKTVDGLRGYKKPYSSTVVRYENDEQTVEDLIEIVTKYFTLSNRFYKLHASLLGQKSITHADRNADIGKINKSFDFEASITLVKNSFRRFDNKYAQYIDDFIANGQIDAFPRNGKRNGAFCWGVGHFPTFVFLNHTNDVRSVETFAHEMGHAIHSELSKTQPPQYRHYTIATAEVASTFFEQMVFEEIEQHLTEKERIALLHKKILGDIMTVFRQIACFNFELELHTMIRSQGELSKTQMATLMNKHMKAYMGPSMKLSEDDGYFFVYWSHIRRFFYVYTYAYGALISRALYEKWKVDSLYKAKIESFLSAGKSMSPKDIFDSIGIKTDKKFFEAGLKGIESDIDRLEKMTKQVKKKK